MEFNDKIYDYIEWSNGKTKICPECQTKSIDTNDVITCSKCNKTTLYRIKIIPYKSIFDNDITKHTVWVVQKRYDDSSSSSEIIGAFNSKVSAVDHIIKENADNHILKWIDGQGYLKTNIKEEKTRVLEIDDKEIWCFFNGRFCEYDTFGSKIYHNYILTKLIIQ